MLLFYLRIGFFVQKTSAFTPRFAPEFTESGDLVGFSYYSTVMSRWRRGHNSPHLPVEPPQCRR